MGNVNKTILVGHLGADPEIKQLNGGRAMARLRVATTERWRSAATGEPEERTEWHRVVVFGKSAEVVAQYLSKGRLVFIEGRLRTNKWQDKEGHEHYSTEIIADEVTFLGKRPEAEAAAA